MLFKVPKVKFLVSKNVNLFYHVCVLFSEYFPDELSLGILNNSSYRQLYGCLKTESLHEKFQQLQLYSYYTWDFVGKSLFELNSTFSVRENLHIISRKIADIWLKIFEEALPPYEDTWAETREKLEKYEIAFETEWHPIYESVLNKMSNMAKLQWRIESINVHLVDCVHGAASWIEDVVLPPFPDMDVEKKLLTHELSHILMPEYFLKTKLQNLGLDPAISHTIVDLTAYFGIKEHLADTERLGMKPNPKHYVQVHELYPIFEECCENPDKHRNFDEILKQIKLRA
jgi:hypothetical protein